jgi:hypothetical protein
MRKDRPVSVFEIMSRATLRLCDTIAERLLDVLEHGTLDDWSRESIRSLYRDINRVSARAQTVREEGNASRRP